MFSLLLLSYVKVSTLRLHIRYSFHCSSVFALTIVKLLFCVRIQFYILHSSPFTY